MSKKENENIKIGVMYIRESTEEQGQGFSPEAQRRGMREFARDNKIKIIGEYADYLSGRKEDRPQFQQMIADAEAKKFDTILVFKTSRFARNRTVANIYKSRLRGMGVRVIFTSENIGVNTNDINEKTMEGLYEVFDEHLSNQISQWTREGFAQKRSEGFLLGRPPLGYYREKGNAKDIFVDNQTAKLVVEMYEMYASGTKSLKDIAVLMNKKDYKTQLGNEFTYSSIKCILQNRVYLGYVPANKPNDEEIKGKHKAIIDIDLFERVQVMFKERNKTKGRPTAQHRFYLLQGLVFCYSCQKLLKGKENSPANTKMLPTMYCQANPSKGNAEKYYYACKFHRENKSCKQKPVLCEIIDRQVLNYMSCMKMPEDVIQAVVERVGLIYDSYKQMDSGSLNKNDEKSLKDKLDKLNFMFFNTETISADYYKEQARKLQEKIAIADSEGMVGHRRISKEKQVKATEIFLRNIPSFIGNNRLSKEETRKWITLTIKRIWIKDKKVVAIEPRDEYKDLFSSTMKVFSQSPLAAP